ncbi:hypothetical protein JCM8547_005454 [Rhodosporidiobolus lusitaniae]
MSRPATPAQSAAALLKSAFQAEAEQANRPGAGPKPEIFKPAQASGGGAWGGGASQWSQTKPGAMADGKDFLQTLSAAVQEKKKANGAGTPAAAPPAQKPNKK